jgi:LuxR family maltose regulon positive regulatory protein
LTFSGSLLKTKLFIPGMRDNLVDRQNITTQLEKGLNTKLTIISAPAGFGKTTILTQWIHKSNKKVCWLSLDKTDNNFNRFWIYFINALQKINPELGNDIIAILNLAEKPQTDYILSMFINGIMGTNNQFIIILDDYHLIEEKSIHEGISFLLAHLPINLHIYISSRFEPDFLPVSRLRAENEIIEIKAASLRFNNEGIKHFFKLRGLNISDLEAGQLEKKTEGWGLSLQLALLSMQDAPDISAFIREFTGNNRYIVDYLLDEILNNLDENIKLFLFNTSILSKFNAGLCETLTGQNESQQIIEELERKNLFIVPLDNNRQWYRYHNLLSDLLYSRLEKDNPGLIKKLHILAARWFSEHALDTEAIRHAFLAGDPVLAGELISQISFKMVSKGEVKTLLEWLEKLPEEIILSRPGLFVYYGWVLTLTSRLEEAEKLVSKTEKLNQENIKDNFPIASQLANIKGTIARRKGEVDLIIKYSGQAIKNMKIPDNFILATAHFNLGIAYMISGNFNLSISEFSKSVPYNLKAANYLTVIAANVCKARITMQLGNLFEAEKLYKQLLNDTNEYKLGKHSITGVIMMDLAQINYHWNNLETANNFLSGGLSLTRHSYNSDSVYGYLCFLQLKAGEHDLKGLEEIISEIEDFSKNSGSAGLISRVAAYSAYSAVLNGKPELAGSWVKEMKQSLQDGFSFSNEQEVIILARCLNAMGNPDEALDLINSLLEKVEQVGIIAPMIRAHLTRSIIFNKKGKGDKAGEAIRQALKLGENGKFIQVFKEEKQVIPFLKENIRLLKTEKKISEDYSNKLLAMVSVSGPEPGPEDNENLLSERELEILKLIESGLSNQEIGEKLFISLNTIKTHIKNLYRKLDVQTRTQALSKAKKLDLF